MLFLMNDVVFDLNEASPVTSADARRFEKLGFDYVMELGCELFAEDPLLHRNDPERARRLAWLIHDRSPEINAALFAAPEVACDPALVEPRFCALPDTVMRQLKARDGKGRLDAVAADRVVWGRMAA
ncbi:MAG: hypothetical protein Q8S03_03735 [Brevundimonas sp.]|uniref:hypothetical protein n=1 Tax=Brevundimonas sp. TaxID=1871086 RepID=UPI00273315F7|nr:hypothetical protein [Brevundimonas sp.]MDP3403777.1 hypothetical protein [Brevundimonas sp.]